MTVAENKCRRLVWRDILESVGGTPAAGDSLRLLVLKTLVAIGGSPHRNDSLRALGKKILAISPTIYSTDGKLNGWLLPTGSALAWGIEPTFS